MSKLIRILAVVLVTALFLNGCSMLTADEMYCLPKRSDAYNHVQEAINKAMSGLTYCAPLSGENQQPVQMADLDGDGVDEYMLFAKSSENRPLRILVFRNIKGDYVHTDTMEGTGTAFDMVEYIQMDDRPGVEIVVGRQVSDQVIRSVSVYTMRGGSVEQLITANYTKFLPVDLDGNRISELLVIRPSETGGDNGTAALYTMVKGAIERSNEVDMSQPADKLKRIIVGKLHGGASAVYVASTVEDTALITDVFTMRENLLANVSFSNESGTSVQTMRNFYVYADDIDNDGVVELPSLTAMKPLGIMTGDDKYRMIRWYAMTPEGTEINKVHTFHNFVNGWYLQLDNELAPRMTVNVVGSLYEFYLWDTEYKSAQKLMSIYAFSGQNKETQATAEGRFVLYRTESTVYAASLEEAAESYGITHDSLIYSFRLIQQDWKTGET